MIPLMNRQQFAIEFMPDAIEVTQGSNIFPETLIVQAIVESQGNVNGTWYPAQSQLAKLGNNLFGIKGSGDLGVINLPTSEYINGGWTIENGAFAKYSSVKESMRDYVDFLQRNPRYTTNGVFNALNPIEQFAALQRSGYATNPNYSNILTSVYQNLSDTFANIPRPVKLTGVLLLGLGLIYLITRKK
jgi:flagellum-specific peptidoglycan hydrolase FlgJ